MIDWLPPSSRITIVPSTTSPAAPAVSASFADRARGLVLRGFKPKDAADVTLQEILLEYRNDPKMMEQARADAADFLRRIKDGLI
jgi:hypothetical protein